MPKTYNEIYINARKKLKEFGVSAYSLEARLITANAAGKTKEQFLRDMHLYSSDQVEAKAMEMLKSRLEGEPVAYIVGDWEFYGLPMTVTKDVLIPRTDTEILVESAIKALKGRKMDARVLDLCTGSGCIGCAIAKELPAAHVVLVDNSTAALAVAKQNLMRNRLNPRVSCIEADALSAPPMMLGSFDVMVCNPPYIPTEQLRELDGSVRNYEPMAALDGGQDGFVFYRAVLDRWLAVVRNGGMVFFEVGIGQAEELEKLMRLAGVKNVETIKDTQGIDRVVCGNA